MTQHTTLPASSVPPDVPIEAIYAELVTVPLFRRWLVAQGGRIFAYQAGAATCLGVYLEEVTGWRQDDLAFRNNHPAWLGDLFSWWCGLYRDYGAPEVLAALDAIVADLAARKEGAP